MKCPQWTDSDFRPPFHDDYSIPVVVVDPVKAVVKREASSTEAVEKLLVAEGRPEHGEGTGVCLPRPFHRCKFIGIYRNL